MPESMLTFINDDDVPPDKRRQDDNPLSEFVANAKRLRDSERSGCDNTSTVRATSRENENELSLTESLTDDTAFSSYSANLTDEAFGSYEANLSNFDSKLKMIGLDEEKIRGGLSKTRRSKNFKVCKSNQTSFSDLTTYYIDSDEDIKYLCLEEEEIKDAIPEGKVIEVKDVSTETVEEASYNQRLRKCISDPVPRRNDYKSRNSFHKDLNEALSSLLWQPYEYQNAPSSSSSSPSSSSSSSTSSSVGDPSSSAASSLSSSSSSFDLGPAAADNGDGPVNNLHKHQQQQRRRRLLVGRSRERGPLSSRSRLSAASLSVCCAADEPPSPTVDDGDDGDGDDDGVSVMSESAVAGDPGAVGNLSQVNVVGLPRTSRTSSNLTVGQFKYNANVYSANIVNLNHQRHHSQSAEGTAQATLVNHARSLSVPKKLDGGGVQENPNGRYPVNVSNVNVNYYRAVPANVVSPVPQIQCVPANDCVSNVNIVQAMPVASASYNFQNLQQCAVTTFGSSIITQHFPSGNTYNVTTSGPVQVQTNPIQSSFAGTSSINTITNTNSVIGNVSTTTTASGTTTTEVTVHNSNNNQIVQLVNRPTEVTRTFTSTEAQTDDTLGTQPIQNSSSTEIQTQTNTSREQRRRERRERRHHRRSNGSNGNQTQSNAIANHQFQSNANQVNDRLPDLLNSHLPPSYNNSMGAPPPPPPPPHHHHHHQGVIGSPLVNASLVNAPLVQTMVPSPIVGGSVVAFPGPVVPGQVPLVQPGPVPVQVAGPTGFRFPFQGAGFRRSRYSEDSPKSCCGLLSMKPGSLRWFIALIAFVAVCCVLVGTVLGAMRTSGRDHLTVSLLMIGVGIVLITVSGIAWKLTSHDSSTCRSMLGLGSTESVDACARRFVPRLPPSYGRPHHPYAAMMYPEFQYRPPPPSYQASMQEYRLRLLLLDRGHTPQIQAAGAQSAVSPPPTYRSHAGSLLRAPLSNRRDAQSEYSCPPSYRSQTSSTRPTNTLPPPSVLHSREQSLSLSESNHESASVALRAAEDDLALDAVALDGLKLEPEADLNPLKMLLKGGSTEKEGNLVTIVQTGDQSPVIVTVSGSSNGTDAVGAGRRDQASEMQILAHL